jgi:EpsI family protein
VLLALLAAAAAAAHLTPDIREGALPVVTDVPPPYLPGWVSAAGAPEEVLPQDPNEKAAVRLAYRRGDQVAWVSVALFTQQDRPDQRASFNLIYPEQNVSRIERVSLPLTRSGRGTPISIPVVVGHAGGGSVVVAYWYHLGGEIYGSEYRYRLALMRAALWTGRVETLLVRVGTRVPGREDLARALAVISEVAHGVHESVRRRA